VIWPFSITQIYPFGSATALVTAKRPAAAISLAPAHESGTARLPVILVSPCFRHRELNYYRKCTLTLGGSYLVV